MRRVRHVDFSAGSSRPGHRRHRRRRRLAALVGRAALAVLAAPMLMVGLVPPQPAAAATSAVPRLDHVVVVIEENHSGTEIIGNANAPYITSLAASGANF